MTQLIQADYARKLMLKLMLLPGKQCFSIHSPGGGSDLIDKFVRLPIRLRTKLHSAGQDSYEETEDEERVREVVLTFGVSV